MQHISNHLALSAPAYGTTARCIEQLVSYHKLGHAFDVELVLTKMAGGYVLETNEDVAGYVKTIKEDLLAKIVFFNVAMCDYLPNLLIQGDEKVTAFDKYADRLETRQAKNPQLWLAPTQKIIGTIRQGRKDIFLVGFKTTCGATKQEMFTKGLNLLKTTSCNLVLVNDTKTRENMIVTPEETTYSETSDRSAALRELVDMALLRSQLTFTQSTVLEGVPIGWDSPEVPSSLRTVVDFCVAQKAYKAFNGATVGHFACKISDTEFLTSIRKSNFNDLHKNGLVRIKTDGPDTVLAYGAKPSVGGQSQRIVFKDHPGMDCIVHFHCPLKQNPRDSVPVRSQKEYECGSHQCGKNTSEGLATFGNLKAVMLDLHGPNIVFSKNINPQEVIDFIEANFDLDKKTGGYAV